MIELARNALARGRADEAIQAVRRHRRDYPRGAFAEEHDALEVTALLLAGQRGEARRRAERFLSRHPDSIFRAQVSRALR